MKNVRHSFAAVQFLCALCEMPVNRFHLVSNSLNKNGNICAYVSTVHIQWINRSQYSTNFQSWIDIFELGKACVFNLNTFWHRYTILLNLMRSVRHFKNRKKIVAACRKSKWVFGAFVRGQQLINMYIIQLLCVKCVHLFFNLSDGNGLKQKGLDLDMFIHGSCLLCSRIKPTWCQ